MSESARALGLDQDIAPQQNTDETHRPRTRQRGKRASTNAADLKLANLRKQIMHNTIPPESGRTKPANTILPQTTTI